MTDRRNSAPGGKYGPLYLRLMKLAGSEWRVSFGDVEEVLGFRLPDSARRHRPWWTNGGHGQALAWVNAGWRTSDVDLGGETLVFRRMDDSLGRAKFPSRKPVSGVREFEHPIGAEQGEPGNERRSGQDRVAASVSTDVDNRRRVDEGTVALRNALEPRVKQFLRDMYGEDWRRRAPGDWPLDLQGLLNVLLRHWNERPREYTHLSRKMRTFIYHAREARNAVSHFSGKMSGREALHYLDAMLQIATDFDAADQKEILEDLYEKQLAATK